MDERVRIVIKLLEDQGVRTRPLNQLAIEIGLSPSRLEHLFKSEVGISIRAFGEVSPTRPCGGDDRSDGPQDFGSLVHGRVQRFFQLRSCVQTRVRHVADGVPNRGLSDQAGAESHAGIADRTNLLFCPRLNPNRSWLSVRFPTSERGLGAAALAAY